MNKYFNILQLVIAFMLLSNCNSSGQKVNDKKEQTKDTTKVTENKSENTKEVSLLFMGDIMQHDLQIQSAWYKEKKKYDFTTQFEYVKPIFAKTDAVVGNFEVTLSGPPYKGYPNFSSPDALAYAVKDAGIEYLGFANNHVYDWGRKGFERTLKMLDSLGFKRTGSFYDEKDKAKHHPMVIEKKGFKIAVFNYVYGINDNKNEKPSVMNFISREAIEKDLKESEGKYDARIIFMHWGTEYERLPNKYMTDLTDFCFEKGADILIGAHPHVIQPMKQYVFTTKSGQKKNVLAAYSLGNFVSNYADWRYCDGGAMVRFVLSKTEGKPLEIKNSEHYLIWVYRPIRTGKLRTYYVLPVSQFENYKGFAPEHDRLFKRFKNDSRKLLKEHNVNVPEANYRPKDKVIFKK